MSLAIRGGRREWFATCVAAAMACGVTPTEVKEAKPAPAPPAPAAAPTPAPPPAPVPRPRTAKDLADAQAWAVKILGEDRRSFFCGCAFSAEGRTNPRSCGYQTRADEGRARTIEWVHVVPARVLGDKRPCWRAQTCVGEDGTRYGGIECCRQSDPIFAAMETDLFNLVPAIAEVAEDRAHYDFAEVPGEARLYGACDLEVDAAGGRVEPAEAIRGDIARVYLYMAKLWAPEIELSPGARAQFEAWNLADPPDEAELRRGAAIAELQGLTNPWLAPAAARP